MIFGIVVLVLIAIIAYFHYVQGLFSATLSAIAAILAAALAFSYHEVVIFSLLKGKVATYAHGMILVAMFALIYLIIRVIFDNAVPGNVRFPLLVDRIGAAVMGVFAGVFATGILAIAAAALPFGAGSPYARYALEEDREVTVPTGGRDQDAYVREGLNEPEPGRFNPEQAGGMIVPADDIVVNMVDRLSNGALAGKRPLRAVHPSYLDELFAQRLGVQVGAARVAFNVQSLQQVGVVGVYSLDQVPQADAEYLQVRGKPIKGSEQPLRKPAPNELLLVVRVNFTRGSDDKDHNVRFSPASVRLVAGGANHMPIGTMDDAGVLRLNLPDDFLVAPADTSVDLVFQMPRDALGLPAAPTRPRAGQPQDADAAATKIDDGIFIEVKRMGVVDLSGKAIEPYPGPLEKTVVRKKNLPAAKAAPAAPAAGAAGGGGAAAGAPAAADAAASPIVFKEVQVSPKIFTDVNVASPDADGQMTFPSGTATLKEKKFQKLDVNMTQTVQLLSRGDYLVSELYAPPGMKVVQIAGTAPTKAPPEPWDWAEKLGQFELVDASGTKYKPSGGWARVKGAQGSDRMVAAWNSEATVTEVPHEEGRPTDVWIAFLVPEGTQLTELHFDGKKVAAVNQKAE